MPKRDLIAAKLFLRLALSRGGPRRRVINVDGQPAYATAIAELKQGGELGRRCWCRTAPYLNNIIEQGHPEKDGSFALHCLRNLRIRASGSEIPRGRGYLSESPRLLSLPIMPRGAVTKPRPDEPRDSFLLRLTDALWALSDPIQIQAAAARHLGERLRANRVFYADILNDKHAVIHQDFVDGLDSIHGHHPVESLATDAAATLRRAEIAVRNDLASDAGLSAATRRIFENAGVASYMAVGLVEDGHWLAALVVQSAAARVWAPQEIDLLQETANRAFKAIERARTLAGKDALLQEAHHRFSNNLQLITSLINLESNAVEDRRLLALLDETRNRVHSIATVYETMRRSQDPANLDMTAYATRLAPALIHAYDAAERVQARIEGEPVTLDLRRAVPFGLLLHELLSNVCKHAFPAGRCGEVSIRLHREDHGNVLTVTDNGIGIRSGLDFHQASSLGLRLVHMLAQQLGGDVTLAPGAGLHVRVRFPVSETTQEDGDESRH